MGVGVYITILLCLYCDYTVLLVYMGVGVYITILLCLHCDYRDYWYIYGCRCVYYYPIVSILLYCGYIGVYCDYSPIVTISTLFCFRIYYNYYSLIR